MQDNYTLSALMNLECQDEIYINEVKQWQKIQLTEEQRAQTAHTRDFSGYAQLCSLSSVNKIHHQSSWPVKKSQLGTYFTF